MKFTLSWLKDHLETDASLEAITDTLTAIGLEVEGVDNPGDALSGFLVAEIVSAEKHPDADRLKLCRVTTGDEEFQVVCGAPNARSGLIGILAQPGDVIPASGQVLKVGKIRGVESRGMMCSAQELELGDDHDGIIELPADTKVGSSAADALALEPVIDVALTPNRVDALGVRGVARDLAAAGLGKLKPLDASAVTGTINTAHGVAMRLASGDSHLCPHFVGRAIKGVTNRESPDWLKTRLSAIGLRPVSALVDITQYLTIDLGRPLHVFDAAKVQGDIGPRRATSGEKVLALNGSEYTLDESMVVIADDKEALGIAGVMGGEPSSCTMATTEVFLESALFDPVNIATTGRSLGIVSDARYCFERGVDPASTILGAEVATKMILQICGGEASDLVIGGTEPASLPDVTFRPQRVSQLGGIAIESTDVRSILERLGFVVTGTAGEAWTVSVPSWRRDVSGEHDLIEEVLRINGYDEIPVASLPRPSVPKPAYSPEQLRHRAIRRVMASRGLHETTTWSFLASDDAKLFAGTAPLIGLENPISSDLDVLRPSLLPNLALAAGRNADRANPDVRLFEVGPTFQGGEPGEQTQVVAGLRAGEHRPRSWSGEAKSVDVFDVKADVVDGLKALGVPVDRLQTAPPETPWYHPGQSGALKLGTTVLAEFGALHPSTLKALDLNGPMVGFELFLDQLPRQKKKSGATRPKFSPSEYQPVERDFAFLVDDSVAVDSIVRAIRGADKELITRVQVFDVYTGENVGAGKKSVALSARLEPTKATLTDAEIDAVSAKVVSAVEKAVGGQLRG